MLALVVVVLEGGGSRGRWWGRGREWVKDGGFVGELWGS